MTRDEVMKRMVLKEASIPQDRATTSNRRVRGSNIVEEPEAHISESFDDFFDYEAEMSEFTPARDTVSNDIDQFTDTKTSELSHPLFMQKAEPIEKPGFLIMEEIVENIEKNDNINIINDDDDDDDDDDEFVFEFVRCSFTKEDGDRCKKQAKKGHEYCGIHERFIRRNS